MAKGRTLFALLSGAALAGGILYLKSLNEKKDPEMAPEGEAPEDAGWKATFTDDNGEEISPEEIRAKFKEDATKAFADFKDDAKVVTDEILIGLQKAVADMKEAIAEAKKAAEARRSTLTEDAEETCESAEEAAKEAFEEAAEKFEEVREAAEEKAEEFAEEAAEKVEEFAEKVEEAISND